MCLNEPAMYQARRIHIDGDRKLPADDEYRSYQKKLLFFVYFVFR